MSLQEEPLCISTAKESDWLSPSHLMQATLKSLAFHSTTVTTVSKQQAAVKSVWHCQLTLESAGMWSRY